MGPFADGPQGGKMRGYQGSFLGFTFNNIHSSTFGITRISEGTRFNDNLSPQFKNITIDVPGGAGQYFFGTNYTKRDFVVKYAYDGVTEEQLSTMKKAWNDNRIHDLIFDETPYKVYSAKLTGTLDFKTIAFENNGQRIYKGEGSLNFTCFFPFARSRYEYQEDYTADNIPEWTLEGEGLDLESNILQGYIIYDFINDESGTVTGSITGDEEVFEDWVYDSSMLIDTEGEYDETFSITEIRMAESILSNYDEWIESSRIPSNVKYGKFQNGYYSLYNAGDIEIPFKIWFILPQNNIDVLNFSVSDGVNLIQFNGIQNKTLINKTADYYCVLDTSSFLLQGYDSQGQPTGTVYNSYLTSGEFFLLPLGEQKLHIEGAVPHKIEIKYYYL